MSPKLLYPAALAAPGLGQMDTIRRAAKRLFPTPWAKWWAPFGLGTLFGVKGAPRHHYILVRAAAAACTWVRDGSWAPSGAPRFGEESLHRALRWACTPPNIDPPALAREAFRESERLRSERRPCDAIHGRGGIVCTALWHEMGKGGWRSWAATRSATRRWWATDGHEWELFRHAPHFTAAFQILRFFCNGVHDGQEVRSEAERNEFPRFCAICGEAASLA